MSTSQNASPQPNGLRRLQNDDFIALRSLRREPWVFENCRDLLSFEALTQQRRLSAYAGINVLWKQNGKWDYGDYFVGMRAIAAFVRLEGLGLASAQVKRCCPGTSCHTNDKVVCEVTQNGLDLVNAKTAPGPKGVVSRPLVSAPKLSSGGSFSWSWCRLVETKMVSALTEWARARRR